MKNLLARVSGALALAAYFTHVGMHLMREYPERVPALAWVGVAFFLVLSVAGAWAQARLNAKRAALKAAFVILGLLPVGAFLFHRAPLDAPGGFGVVLLLNLVFGVMTLVFTGWLLAGRAGESGA